MKLYIAFCYRDALLSRLIRFFTRSKYGHTAAIVEDEAGSLTVYDAQKEGVSGKTYFGWMNRFNYKFDTIEITPDVASIQDAISRLKSKDGKTRYDIVSLVFRQPIELITDKWLEDNTTDDRMYCSEYNAWALRFRDAYRLSPQRLFERLMSYPVKLTTDKHKQWESKLK